MVEINQAVFFTWPDPLDLSFLSFLTFLHHGIGEIESFLCGNHIQNLTGLQIGLASNGVTKLATRGNGENWF